MMLMLPKTTVLALGSLAAQVMVNLPAEVAARIAEENAAGQAGLTDDVAEIALAVVLAGSAFSGTLDGYWEAVAAQAGGVPLYDVADAIVRVLATRAADTTWDLASITQQAVAASLALAMESSSA